MTASPTCKLTHWRGSGRQTRGWGRVGESPEEEGRAENSSTEILTEGRLGVPAKSLKLGNTGFARSLADQRRLSQWSTDIA